MAERGVSARALFYWEQRRSHFADFIALGRACGLGSASRLGILLHPVFGPWFSIRAIVLTRAALARTPPQSARGLCDGCPAPCATACPGGALAHDRFRFDVAACSRTTLALEACRQRCDARRACVIGREHTYRPEVERMFRSAVVQLL